MILSSFLGCVIVTSLSVIPTKEYFFDEQGSKVSHLWVVRLKIKGNWLNCLLFYIIPQSLESTLNQLLLQMKLIVHIYFEENGDFNPCSPSVQDWLRPILYIGVLSSTDRVSKSVLGLCSLLRLSKCEDSDGLRLLLCPHHVTHVLLRISLPFTG